MKSMKIRTNGEEELIQKILLEKGCRWIYEDPMNLSQSFKFVYVGDDGSMICGDDDVFFDNDLCTEYILDLVPAPVHVFTCGNVKAGDFVINKRSPKESKDYSFAASVTYKIIFKKEKDGVLYGLSSIRDGMVHKFMKKEELVDLLNKQYRPLTKQEYIKIYSKDR